MQNSLPSSHIGATIVAQQSSSSAYSQTAVFPAIVDPTSVSILWSLDILSLPGHTCHCYAIDYRQPTRCQPNRPNNQTTPQPNQRDQFTATQTELSASQQTTHYNQPPTSIHHDIHIKPAPKPVNSTHLRIIYNIQSTYYAQHHIQVNPPPYT